MVCFDFISCSANLIHQTRDKGVSPNLEVANALQCHVCNTFVKEYS